MLFVLQEPVFLIKCIGFSQVISKKKSMYDTKNIFNNKIIFPTRLTVRKMLHSFFLYYVLQNKHNKEKELLLFERSYKTWIEYLAQTLGHAMCPKHVQIFYESNDSALLLGSKLLNIMINVTNKLHLVI